MNRQQIRPATLDDLQALVEFNMAIAQETERMRLLPDVVSAGVRAVLSDRSRGFYLVSELDGQVIGAMMVTLEWSDWRNGNFWWVQSVYVRPEHRRQGVFANLYRHAQELAAGDRSVCGFRLYVEKNNLSAQRTYTSLGLEQTHYLVFESLKPGIRFHE